MAIRIITVDSKGAIVSASTPSYTAKTSFQTDGVKIVADGFGFSIAAELSAQQVNPVLHDTFSFSESINYTWTYGKLYEDTANFSETQQFSVGKSIADTATLTDTVSNSSVKSVTDTFGLIEELLFTRIVFLTFEDVVIFSEDFNNTGEQQQWVHFSEIQSMLYEKGIAETVTFAETASNLFNSAQTESVAISEVSNLTYAKPISETVNIVVEVAVSVQDYFAEDYFVGSGDQPYFSSYQAVDGDANVMLLEDGSGFLTMETGDLFLLE